MLDAELTESLCSGKGALEAIDTASKVVLGLVKDLFLLQNIQNAVLSLHLFFGVYELAQAFDIKVRASTLLCQQIGALGSTGLQVLDPCWVWDDHCEGMWLVSGMGG